MSTYEDPVTWFFNPRVKRPTSVVEFAKRCIDTRAHLMAEFLKAARGFRRDTQFLILTADIKQRRGKCERSRVLTSFAKLTPTMLNN